MSPSRSTVSNSKAAPGSPSSWGRRTRSKGCGSATTGRLAFSSSSGVVWTQRGAALDELGPDPAYATSHRVTASAVSRYIEGQCPRYGTDKNWTSPQSCPATLCSAINALLDEGLESLPVALWLAFRPPATQGKNTRRNDGAVSPPSGTTAARCEARRHRMSTSDPQVRRNHGIGGLGLGVGLPASRSESKVVPRLAPGQTTPTPFLSRGVKRPPEPHTASEPRTHSSVQSFKLAPVSLSFRPVADERHREWSSVPFNSPSGRVRGPRSPHGWEC